MIEDKIQPRANKVNFSLFDKFLNIAIISITAMCHIFMVLFGVIVVAIALPFSTKYGEINKFGWQLEKLPDWAWLWSNDYDGIQGQKNGVNYTSNRLDSYKGKYWWTAIRNPANNWSRYVLGFSYNDIYEIQYNEKMDVNEDMGSIGSSYYRAYKKDSYMFYPSYMFNNGKYFLKFGWKIDSFRYTNRPFAGFTISMGKVK